MLWPPAMTNPKTPIAFAPLARPREQDHDQREERNRHERRRRRPGTARAATRRPCVVARPHATDASGEERDPRARNVYRCPREGVAQAPAQEEKPAEGEQVSVWPPTRATCLREAEVGPDRGQRDLYDRPSRGRSSGRPCRARSAPASAWGVAVAPCAVVRRVSVILCWPPPNWLTNPQTAAPVPENHRQRDDSPRRRRRVRTCGSSASASISPGAASPRPPQNPPPLRRREESSGERRLQRHVEVRRPHAFVLRMPPPVVARRRSRSRRRRRARRSAATPRCCTRRTRRSAPSARPRLRVEAERSSAPVRPAVAASSCSRPWQTRRPGSGRLRRRPSTGRRRRPASPRRSSGAAAMRSTTGRAPTPPRAARSPRSWFAGS